MLPCFSCLYTPVGLIPAPLNAAASTTDLSNFCRESWILQISLLFSSREGSQPTLAFGYKALQLMIGSKRSERGVC